MNRKKLAKVFKVIAISLWFLLVGSASLCTAWFFISAAMTGRWSDAAGYAVCALLGTMLLFGVIADALEEGEE